MSETAAAELHWSSKEYRTPEQEQAERGRGVAPADELALEKHVDSIADQIIEMTSEECKLTKGLRPQMGLSFVKRPVDYW